MDQINQTLVTYFIMLGISDVFKLQTQIFILVLFFYLLILGGNMTILLLVCLDAQLKTPMYFFLGNLALMDMFSPTVPLQNIMASYMLGDNTVTYCLCMTQMFIYSSLIAAELYLLMAMSYDRFVAICNPLYYPLVMRRRVCVMLATVCWVFGFVEFTPYFILLLNISCYKSNIINHFFCDFTPIMKLSCSDTTLMKILVFTEGIFIIFLTPFLLTFISYIYIIAAILKIRTHTGRRKAFYTCSSHLSVIILFYGTLTCQYLITITSHTLQSNKYFSLFNIATVPVLNPLIYSLKNKDMKSAFKRQLRYLKNHISYHIYLKFHQLDPI
ncbi:olfactory receptor 5AR1-like [Discoglossus pictus]